MTSSSSAASIYRRHRLLLWSGGILAALIVTLFFGSFFLDAIVRTRTQAAINQKLKGYHVAPSGQGTGYRGVSHLLKNFSTRQLATDIDLKGRLTSPDVNTWQAIAQVMRNAFIEAIIPGFDRAVALSAANNTAR